MDASDWGKDVRSLQERVMSQAESGEVSSVANQLAKAASEVADVARASLSSTDEGQPANFGLSPEEHKEGKSRSLLSQDGAVDSACRGNISRVLFQGSLLICSQHQG